MSNFFQNSDIDVNKAEIWGIQYHPEIPYDYMLKLIKHRSKGLLNRKIFKDSDELGQHIKVIEQAKVELKDQIRTLELKNWINYIKNK